MFFVTFSALAATGDSPIMMKNRQLWRTAACGVDRLVDGIFVREPVFPQSSHFGRIRPRSRMRLSGPI
jgi:hypothetical protein